MIQCFIVKNLPCAKLNGQLFLPPFEGGGVFFHELTGIAGMARHST
jgi:hypothetical protein